MSKRPILKHVCALAACNLRPTIHAGRLHYPTLCHSAIAIISVVFSSHQDSLQQWYQLCYKYYKDDSLVGGPELIIMNHTIITKENDTWQVHIFVDVGYGRHFKWCPTAWKHMATLHSMSLHTLFHCRTCGITN
jgi:hypothetical protein